VFKIKKIILSLIDFSKKSLFLLDLNEAELKGFISKLSKLRFFPYTKIQVPFNLGRTIRGISFKENIMLDPNGKLCKNIFNDISENILFDDISTILEKESKRSAADIVGLENNINLKNYPAWAIVMPWEKLSIEDKFEKYPQAFFENRLTRGFVFENNSRASIINMMYSSKFAENRVKQMRELYKIIKRNGYVERDSNLPKINILIKDHEWRWFMGDGGNHRSYILSCLNHDYFTARINSVIDKSQVNDWHNVRNGTYSVSDAEYIFDSYFDGTNVLRGMV
jgi:hypothetical protein